MRSLAFWPAMVVVVVGTIVIGKGLNHAKQFEQAAEIKMPPQLAETLGLVNSGQAAFGGELWFRKNARGGYDYRQSGLGPLLEPLKHTDMNVDAECKKARTCEFKTR